MALGADVREVTSPYMGAAPMTVSASNRRSFALAVVGVLATASPASAAPPPVVTLLGDSITAGLGLSAAEALPAQLQAALAARGVRAMVRGAGVSGDTTAGALARTDFSVQPDTAVCVIELGGNDFLQSLGPADTERNLRAIIAKLQRRRIAVVLAGGRLPERETGAYGREFSAVFPRVAKATHVLLAPDLLDRLFTDRTLRQADGLHPNSAGVRLLASRLAPFVAQALLRRTVARPGAP